MEESNKYILWRGKKDGNKSQIQTEVSSHFLQMLFYGNFKESRKLFRKPKNFSGIQVSIIFSYWLCSDSALIAICVLTYHPRIAVEINGIKPSKVFKIFCSFQKICFCVDRSENSFKESQNI